MPTRMKLLVFALAIVLGLSIYARGFRYPLIFDDLPAITHNLSIHHLWPLSRPLHPPDDSPLSVRPLVNLSLAVNYWLGRDHPAGYRAVNLAIHLATAMLMFRVLRRSGQFHQPSPEGEGSNNLFAAVVSLLWVVHPLNTEAVIYITQRTELMVSFFYLLTLYAAIRGFQGKRGWFLLAVAACAAGMASKEVMVSAPIFILLYDRTLVSGTFRNALRKSPWLYAGLAATWGLLIFLLATQSRAQSAGLGVGIPPLQYLRTQAGVILWYLRLCIWPYPLTVAHNWPLSPGWLASLPAGLCVVALLALTAWLLWKRSWLGLLGRGFF